ncbi:MAG: hypothetical protein HKP61_15230 [Dactylosporangium sp.]|nr:YbaK/EbsC family protein [Dactylosporangium sp.]NNJ62262.1 hypothetical protein [Dactylosporangium sp.]
MVWTLSTEPAALRPDLLAVPVVKAVQSWSPSAGSGQLSEAVRVAAIDPDLADTAAFCQAYGVLPEESANCVIVAGKRGGELRYAACVVLATTRADVNGIVRRRLDARKASFASMDTAVALTGMEYGGITPIGLPEAWPVLIDPRVIAAAAVVIGSGVRGSKLALPGRFLSMLPNAEVVDGLGQPG